MYIYTYYCIFIHKAIKGATRRGTRAGAFSPVYIAIAFIYALVRLYLYILHIFLFSLIIAYVILYLIAYLMQKVNYMSLLIAYARGGSGIWGFFGRFGAFLGARAGRVRLTVVLWMGGGFSGRFAGAFGRVFPCSRALGCTPAIFRARPTPAGLPSHSVRRICGGISRGVRVSAE